MLFAFLKGDNSRCQLFVIIALHFLRAPGSHLSKYLV